ncbi:hypothetical protein [Cupriavidus pauculus]|uniref:hypothetical protein n=1 Tax=Cupriavidus pauculus TaxID=82633 RepID=UPI000C777F0A|nr:hypothetical protein [Cupriavidus pauculus]
MRCCEDCHHFTGRDRHGWPGCSVKGETEASRIEQSRALKGTNALNRCPLFAPPEHDEPENDQ